MAPFGMEKRLALVDGHAAIVLSEDELAGMGLAIGDAVEVTIAHRGAVAWQRIPLD